MNFYSTGEVAKKLDISVRTLRYYDQIGLLIPSQKDEYGKRLYSDSDLLILQKITILKMLNLSLHDIKKILSKITIKQLLQAHRESLELQINELSESIKNTNTIISIVHLEGEINWEQLIPLIQEAKNREKPNQNWSKYFDEQEEDTLKATLPKMEEGGPEIKKWINVTRRLDLCIQKGVLPESEEAQIIAEDVLILSDELFRGDKELANKFYEIRKSEEKSKDINLYPVKGELLEFLEKAIEIYEKNKVLV